MTVYEEFIKNIEKELEETKENDRVGKGVAVYYAGYINGLRMALALAPKAEEIMQDLDVIMKKKE